MGRFDFESPGAAFTEQISKELAQRKAEQRQSMLDQLTMNSDVRAQEESARRKTESDAQLADTREQRRLQKLGIIGGNMNPGEDPSSLGLSPEDIELGKSLAMFRRQPTPSVSSTAEFTNPETGEQASVAGPASTPEAPVPPRLGYVGDKGDRDKQRQRDMSAQFIFGLYNDKDPKRAQYAKFAEQQAMLNDGIVPGAVMAQLMQPEVPVNIFDMDSGQMTSGGTVPANSQLITRTRPPRDYKPRNMMQAMDANGNLALIDQESLSIDPATGIAKLPEGYTAARGSNGASNQFIPLGISNGAYESYMEELRLLEPNEAGVVAPGDMLGLRQRAAKIISDAKVAPKVRDLAMRFVGNPDSIGSESLSQQEALQFRQLLNVIAAAPSVVDIYRRNAIKTAPKPAAPAAPGSVIKDMTETPKTLGPSDMVLGRYF